MEIVDKVDINDQVIGVTNKVEAHENGYIHRVAAIFVFTPDNNLLVQLRKKDGLMDHSVGGHVKQGESYDEAALRELKEELGIDAEIKNLGTFYGDEIMPNRNLKIDHYFGFYESKLTNEGIKQINIAKNEVAMMIPMKLEDLSVEMRKAQEKFTIGFIRTFNFYIVKHKLTIPLAELK